MRTAAFPDQDVRAVREDLMLNITEPSRPVPGAGSLLCWQMWHLKMSVILSLTNRPYPGRAELGSSKYCNTRRGGGHLKAETQEEANLIWNVTVIYRLYFLGKVQRFIPERQAICKHTAWRCVGAGKHTGASATCPKMQCLPQRMAGTL